VAVAAEGRGLAVGEVQVRLFEGVCWRQVGVRMKGAVVCCTG
jgi:hypothetical protein